MKFTNPFKRKQSLSTQDNNQLWEQLYFNIGKNFVEKLDPKKARDYIEKGYVINPLIYSTINILLREIKQVEWGVFEVKEEKAHRENMRMKSFGRANESREFMYKGLEPFNNTDLKNLLSRPNECQSFTEFIEESFGYWYLTGNSFIYGLTPTGFDSELWTKVYNMPSQYTKIKANGWMQPVQAYTIDWSQRQQLIEAERVFHYKKFNPNYSQEGHNLYGMSPMSPLCTVVNRSNENYNAGLALIENGMPAGMLSTTNGSRPMSEPEITAADAAIKKKYGGGKNANKIMVTSAPLKWHKMGLNVGDMQLLESNKADAQDIAKVYGIPLPLVDNDASTYNNVQEAKTGLWQNVIMPDLSGFAEGFGNWLLAGYRKKTGKNLVLDFDASAVPALQDDLNSLSTRLIGEMEKGIWTPNEVKRMLGRPLDSNAPHLDKYILSNNLTILGNEEREAI